MPDTNFSPSPSMGNGEYLNINLLQALNAAAADIQRSARSEQDVLKAFNQQVRQAGFHGTLSLIEPDGKSITIVATTQSTSTIKNLIEQTGRSLIGYHFPLASIPELRPVIEQGETVFLSDSTTSLQHIFHTFTTTYQAELLEKYGGQPAFFTPLYFQQKISGAFHIFGKELIRADQPTIEAFANQISVALENARLFASLQETEALYRNLYESSAHGILTIDPETTTILSVNPRMVELLGHSCEELIGKQLPGLHPAEYRENCLGLLDKATKGQEVSIDMPISHPDGRQIFVHASITQFTTNNQPLLQIIFNDITEIKAMQETVNARAREAEMLRQASLALTSSLELDQVLEQILINLEQVVSLDSASVFLFDQGDLLGMAARGRIERDSFIGKRFNGRDTLFLHIQETQKPLILEHANLDPRFNRWGGTDFVQSWMGIPMIVRGVVIGYLTCDNEKPALYTIRDAEIALSFATQASIAIENARLFKTEHQARLRAETLHDASQVIGSSLSLREVLYTILDQLAQILYYDSSNIMLVRGEKLFMQAWRGYEKFCDPGLVPQTSYDIETVAHFIQIIRRGEISVVPDTTQDPTWIVYAISGHVRSWLGVPLKVRGQTIGLLSLDRVDPGAFAPEEISLTEAYAVHAATAIENALLYEEQGLRAIELETIRKASLSLTSSLDLHEVLDSILKHTLGLLPDSQNAHIFLYDSQRQGKLTFSAALWADGGIHQPYREPRENGLTATVAHSGEIIVIPDMAIHPIFSNAPTDWKGAIIGVPLKFGNRVVGVMNIAFHQARQFTDAEVRMIRLLGDQAAIAIENARLFQQAATERRHLSLLYQIGRDVISSLNPNEVLERAIALTCQVLGGIVGQAFVYLPEEDHLSLRALYGRPAVRLEHINYTYPIRPGLGLAGWVAKTRQPEFLGDVQNDPRWYHVPDVDADVRSAITAPILAGDKLLGVLSVSHHRENAFTDDHLDLMMAICQEVGLALSNAYQYQEVQRRLAEMTLLQNLTQTLNQRFEPRQMLGEIAKQLSIQGNYDLVRIYQVENDQPELAAQAGGLDVQYDPFIQDPLERVIDNGQAIIHVEAHQIENSNLLISWACVPVFRQTTVIGAICVASQQGDSVSARDIDLLEILAGQLSIALENIRLYEQIITHADELEDTVFQRTTELTELYELSQEIGFSLSYDDLLELLLLRLQNAFRNELVAGYLSGSGSTPLALTINRPISPIALSQLKQVLSDVLREYDQDTSTVHELNPEIVKPSEHFDRESPLVEELTTFITAPIFTGKRLAGLLILASEQVSEFQAEQYRLLNTFANQARTAVQRLEAILTAQQKHLERLVENIPIGTVLLDETLNILVANPRGQEILAVLDDQTVSNRLTSLGSISMTELIARQDDPLPMTIELNGVPHRVFEAQIRPVQGEVRQWVLTLREVTRERESQERIQSQERLATVGQLAAGIAHDFNNIMAAILVYADLLRTDPNISTYSQEKLDIIERQIQRAASLIRQILDFSRRSVMEQTDIDLLPFTKELELILERVLPETIRLELNYQPGSYMVNVDPTRLQQVFMNLALNARDAMPQGGTLQFELGRQTYNKYHPAPIADMPEGNWVTIKVKDTGHGIPPEIQQHLFEPFFTTKPVGKGTGLGLAQVYGIIRNHDGFINIESEVGEGTTVNIYLPALNKNTGSLSPLLPSQNISGSGQTILLVEDDPATREALQTLLEVNQFHVLTAPDGIHGLAMYEKTDQPVSMVISDLVMPEMGGIELYKQIRQQRPETKILFITGHPLNEQDQITLEQGNIHWLQKPFSVREFNQAVQDLLGQPPQESKL